MAMGAARSKYRIVFRGQPKIVEDFCECPPGCNAFTCSPAKALDVLPSKLIGEVYFVVSRSINLVVRAPPVAVRLAVA